MRTYDVTVTTKHALGPGPTFRFQVKARNREEAEYVAMDRADVAGTLFCAKFVDVVRVPRDTRPV
jgi:hypothetical protein